MLHFFDMLHVTVLPEEESVLLSVRVTDSRVDEYRLGLELFRTMAETYSAVSESWSGPDDLQVKVDPSRRLASLAVRTAPLKREVHRIGQSQFEAMLAQFRAQDVRG